MTMPKHYDPATGLPFRVPGQRSQSVVVQRLTPEAFGRGLELLAGTVQTPRSGPPLQAYYDLVRYELSEIEWLRAVRETIRDGNEGRSRVPSPATMIARAGVAPVAIGDEDNPHAGRWVFRCQGCGRRGMTNGAPIEPPQHCRECEGQAEWASHPAEGGSP